MVAKASSRGMRKKRQPKKKNHEQPKQANVDSGTSTVDETDENSKEDNNLNNGQESESRSESRSESEAESEAESKAESEGESKAESEAESEAESRAESTSTGDKDEEMGETRDSTNRTKYQTKLVKGSNKNKRITGIKGSKEAPKKKALHKRLKMHFPVSRIRRFLKRTNPGHRVSTTAPIFIAAVLEYLIGELIESGAVEGRAQKRSTIKPRHLKSAIKDDNEMSRLLGPVTIANGGVGGRVNIEPVLITKKGKPIVASVSEEHRSVSECGDEESQEYGAE